jgi:hypothetical protein
MLTPAAAGPQIAAMPDSPEVTRNKALEQAARQERLAQALRDNLRRRKEQTRARAATRGSQAEPESNGEEDRADPGA